jgi:hypothetical protein
VSLVMARLGCCWYGRKSRLGVMRLEQSAGLGCSDCGGGSVLDVHQSCTRLSSSG